MHFKSKKRLSSFYFIVASLGIFVALGLSFFCGESVGHEQRLIEMRPNYERRIAVSKQSLIGLAQQVAKRIPTNLSEDVSFEDAQHFLDVSIDKQTEDDKAFIVTNRRQLEADTGAKISYDKKIASYRSLKYQSAFTLVFCLIGSILIYRLWFKSLGGDAYVE